MTTTERAGTGDGLVEMAWDPITRIVGSLGIYTKIDFKQKRVAECFSTSSIFRGYSIFMKGKDPRDDSLAPGGSSMNGMNLSGNPGMVQPMQMPPTFGQPPTPLIQPRFGTLHLTTGPQHPSLTMHFGEPYSFAKSPCS